MKMNYLFAASAMLASSVLLCSCWKDEPEAKPVVPQQEMTPQTEAPQAEPLLDNGLQDDKLAAEKKAEPAPAGTTPEPAPAPEKKKADNATPPPGEHVVKTGDNLWKISKKYYGKGSQWKRIYEANKTVIKKKDFLEPGTVLVIPPAK